MSNSQYKGWHKPNMSENARTKQGYYKVQHREKYVGDPNLVVYRSSWEMKFAKWCDYSPSVKRWSSEPMSIPYWDRISNIEKNNKQKLDNNNPRNWKKRNYHTDFWCEVVRDDTIEKWFIEIKPAHKLKKPKPPAPNSTLKVIKNFNNRAKTYLIDEAKFASLNEWAKKHNMKFYVFTEHTLEKVIGRMWN